MTSVRNTVQKKLVYEAAFALDHPTAEEVYCKVTKEQPSISRATVYRILNNLAYQNKLLKIKIPDSAVRYDKTLDRHFHIRCINCGKVEDINIENVNIKNMKEFQGDFKSYSLLDYTLVFEGLCPVCRK